MQPKKRTGLLIGACVLVVFGAAFAAAGGTAIWADTSQLAKTVVAAVIAWLNLRLTANQLSTETQAALTTALGTYDITATSSTSAKLDMLATACFLVLISPDYLVQK